MSALRKDDPAYWMLEEGLADPSKRTTPSVYSERCYICRDPEFAMMGLPLCVACPACGGHIAADDATCDDCGLDAQAAEIEREVLSQRGRWLVVYESHVATRHRRLSRARAEVALADEAGIRAHVIRYRRRRVRYAGGTLEITDGRWLP